MKTKRQLETVVFNPLTAFIEEVRNDAWLCGFGIALAEHNRRFGNPDVVVDVMRGAGVTIEKLRAAKLDGFDLKELRKCVRKGSK